MAIRGVVTELNIFTEQWDYPPVYRLQNYFQEPTDFFGVGLESQYRAFSVSPFSVARDMVTAAFTVNFPGLSQNIELVEECLDNRYRVQATIFRWDKDADINNPTAFQLFGGMTGDAVGGSTDFTSVQLKVSSYANTVGNDFPGRTIPWQIIAPLSTRI